MRMSNQLLLTGAALAASLAFSAKPAGAAAILTIDFEGGQALGNGAITTDQSNSPTHSWDISAGLYGSTHYQPFVDMPVLGLGQSFGSFTLNYWVKPTNAASASYYGAMKFSKPDETDQSSFHGTYSNAGTSSTNWTEVVFDLTTAANAEYATGRTSVYQFYISNYSVADHFYVDDISINYTIIPEPASMSVLGVGGLLLMARRRRIA